MKLAYKLLGLVLASGASVAAYLLIPALPVETIESGPEPLPEKEKSSASWKTSLVKQGYVPVSLGDPFEYFPRITEAFKKAKNIEDGTESSKLRSLCNSLEAKDTLSPNEEEDAKRWCSKPREIGEILTSNGRRYIYTENGSMRDWNRAKLRNLAEKYMKNQDPSLKMARSWENSEELVIDNKDLDGDFDSFKDACVNVLTTPSFEEDLDQKTKQATEWCTESA